MTTQEFSQLENLINKLSFELKSPICIVQSIHDGWTIGRYTDDGNLKDQLSGYSIEWTASKLLASDVTKQLISHDIIG